MILVISVREIVIGDHFDFIRDVICICPSLRKKGGPAVNNNKPNA